MGLTPAIWPREFLESRESSAALNSGQTRRHRNKRILRLCLYLTSSSNTNTFVVDRKHFFEITNICNHKFTNMFKLFNLPESHLYYGISSDYDNR